MTSQAPAPAPQVARPPIPSHRLVMIIFLAAETMLFTGLLGGYAVLRISEKMWPPEGQPLLPIGAGALNLLLLAAGSFGIASAVRGARGASQRRLVRGILLSVAAGAIFLGVLGVEWVRLFREGLTLESGGTYATLFYTLTGCHALHVLAVVIWTVALLALAGRDRFSPAHHEPIEMAAMFWHFVTVAWLVLFVILYPL